MGLPPPKDMNQGDSSCRFPANKWVIWCTGDPYSPPTIGVCFLTFALIEDNKHFPHYLVTEVLTNNYRPSRGNAYNAIVS